MLNISGRREGAEGGRFRVWLIRAGDWQPAHGLDLPPQGVAIEPACDGCLSPLEAATYVAGFNEARRQQALDVWAVAVPVRVRYDGDPTPGAIVQSQPLPLPPLGS